MKICFDLDGTTIDSQTAMCNLASKLLDKDIYIEDWTTYNPSHCFTEDISNALRKIWNLPDIYSISKPFEDAVIITDYLMKLGNTIDIYTFSDNVNAYELAIAKEKCLARNNIKYNRFISDTSDKDLSKYDAVIEDSSSNLIKYKKDTLGKDTIAILMDRPWNRDFDESAYGIIRIKTLAESLPFLLDRISMTQ